MTAIKLRCHKCQGEHLVHGDATLLILCTDDPSLSVIGWDCPTCGPQLRPLNRFEVIALQEANLPTEPWARTEVLADLRREQLAVIREFSDRLDDTLDRILDEAC